MRTRIPGFVTMIATIGAAILNCSSQAEALEPAAAVTELKVQGAAASCESRETWTPLFNGHNLDGWYTFLQKHGKNSDPDHVITIEDGAIHLYKDAADQSHVVMGYIGTEKEYGNYHLRLQYRWGTKKFEPRYKLKRDAGLYYHILGPDAVWPRRSSIRSSKPTSVI